MAIISPALSQFNDNEVDQGSVLSEALHNKIAANLNANFTGRWRAGDIKMHYSYNNTIPAGPGWMKCDGRVVSEANYNTEHGAGTWDTEVITSVLDGLRLPDFTSNKYPTGTTLTTQSGGSPITTVGNSGSTINIQHSHTVNSHTHTIPDHNHMYYSVEADGDERTIFSFNSAGSLKALNEDDTNTASNGFETDNDGVHTDGDLYTAMSSLSTGGTAPGTGNALSTTQSVKPESIEVEFYMCVVN